MLHLSAVTVIVSNEWQQNLILSILFVGRDDIALSCSQKKVVEWQGYEEEQNELSIEIWIPSKVCRFKLCKSDDFFPADKLSLREFFQIRHLALESARHESFVSFPHTTNNQSTHSNIHFYFLILAFGFCWYVPAGEECHHLTQNNQ